MMYECQSCGCRFDEPRYHKEYTEAWGRMVYEVVSGCPRCDGGHIEIEDLDERFDDNDTELACNY